MRTGPSFPAALAVATVLVLPGCTSPELTPGDLAGTFTDSDGGTLALHDDETYELSGVPANVLDGEDSIGSAEEPYFSGTWGALMPEATADVIMLDVDAGSGAYPYANLQIWIDSVDRLYVYPNGVDRGPRHFFNRTS